MDGWPLDGSERTVRMDSLMVFEDEVHVCALGRSGCRALFCGVDGDPGRVSWAVGFKESGEVIISNRIFADLADSVPESFWISDNWLALS